VDGNKPSWVEKALRNFLAETAIGSAGQKAPNLWAPGL